MLLSLVDDDDDEDDDESRPCVLSNPCSVTYFVLVPSHFLKKYYI